MIVSKCSIIKIFEKYNLTMSYDAKILTVDLNPYIYSVVVPTYINEDNCSNSIDYFYAENDIVYLDFISYILRCTNENI